MPSKSPESGPAADAMARTLGETLRRRRLALGVSAADAAEAAGMSRVTWHRLERGVPAVTLGAWIGACSVLGLRLEAAASPLEPDAGSRVDARSAPIRFASNKAADEVLDQASDAIRLADYPQLARLAWQRDRAHAISRRDALSLYERNWRHVDRSAMPAQERELVDELVRTLGRGCMLV